MGYAKRGGGCSSMGVCGVPRGGGGVLTGHVWGVPMGGGYLSGKVWGVEGASHSACVGCAGGVSMGEKDFMKPLLEQHGKVHFGKVKMKPGKPLTFATIDTDAPRQVPCFSRP